jgi:membrane protease YdiL (CAAX protease family)
MVHLVPRVSAPAPADFQRANRRTLWRQVVLVYAALQGALWTSGVAQACFIALTVVLAAAWALVESPLQPGLGLDRRSMGRGWWIVAVAALVSSLILVGAWRLQTLRVPVPSPKLGVSIAMSLIWALAQQFLLQSFFFVRFERLLCSGRRAVIGAALLFSSAHVPNPVLVPVTLAGGLLLSAVFRRYRNLYPLAVAHSLVALSLAISIPESVLRDLRVGIAYVH